MTGVVYTVSEINNLIKDELEKKYSQVLIEGEISNSKIHSSGHMYFTLKDETSQLKAVMFSFNLNLLKFKPENGIKVIARGRLTCFVKTGQYQIVCTNLEPLGFGNLNLAYIQLKDKLEKEGLFDKNRKKPLPLLPQRIGIITSPTGAAIKDILSIIHRRYVNLDILIYPVNVQGDEAKNDISNALDYLNKNHKGLDVILLGRGGGSLEDLWAFNEEIVARAIAASEIPIISCVGHEVDYVISDFVSDARAATPSDAALLVVKNKDDLVNTVNSFGDRLNIRMNHILEILFQRLDTLTDRKVFKDPSYLLENKKQDLVEYLQQLNINIENKLVKYVDRLNILREKLNVLSPNNLLKKGYSIATKIDNNKIIKNVSQVKINEDFNLKLYKGNLICKIVHILEGDDE